MLAAAAGGWYTNSLALVADAGHMLTDVVAMGLTLTAAWLAERPATERKTYGYYRLEILAAFANGIILVLLSIWVVYEAVQRWRSPAVQILGGELTLIAMGGLVINLIAARLLTRGAQGRPEPSRRVAACDGRCAGFDRRDRDGCSNFMEAVVLGRRRKQYFDQRHHNLRFVAADHGIGERPARRDAAAHRSSVGRICHPLDGRCKRRPRPACMDDLVGHRGTIGTYQSRGFCPALKAFGVST